MVETKAQLTAVQEADLSTHLHPFTSAAEHAEGVPQFWFGARQYRQRVSEQDRARLILEDYA